MADMRINIDPSTAATGLSQTDEVDTAEAVQNDIAGSDENLSGYSKAEENIAERICIPCAERIVGDILFSEKATVSLTAKERQSPERERLPSDKPAIARKKEPGYTLDEFESKKLSVCKQKYNELSEQKKAATRLYAKAKTEDEKKTASRHVMEVRRGLYDLIEEMRGDAIDNRPYTFSPTFNELFSKARNDLSELRMISKKTTIGE